MRLARLFFLAASVVLAETWRVEPGGALTLAAAVQQARPGDSIVLAPGVHPCGVALNCKGTLTAPITVRAEAGAVIEGRVSKVAGPERLPGTENLAWYPSPELPIVCLTPTLYDPDLVILNAYRRVETRAELAEQRWGYWQDPESGRLLVTWPGHGPPPARLVALHDGRGLIVTGNHLRLDDVHVRRIAGDGLLFSGCAGIVVRRADISGVGYAWAAGCRLAGTREVSITDSRIYRVMNGFQMNDAERTHLAYNLVYATRAHGIIMYRSRVTIIRNNILFAGGGSGSALYVGRDAAEGLDLDRNCYRNYSGSGALLSFDHGARSYPTFAGWRAVAGPLDRHSIAADPKFVDLTPGEEDFRLAPDSPCRPDIGPRE